MSYPSEFLLLDDQDTELLRSCLWSGEAARNAFARWSEHPERAMAHVRTEGATNRRMLPLLHASLARARIYAPPALKPILQAAVLYEELRTTAYREIASTVLHELIEGEIPFLAMRGICFSATLYQASGLRHCHDIDLLIPEDKLEEAQTILMQRCDFNRPHNRARDGSVLLMHSSGLPIFLHQRALHTSIDRSVDSLSWGSLWERRSTIRAYGVEFHMPSPNDSLVQLCAHRLIGPKMRNLIWLSDAWRLVQSGTVEWGNLQRNATDAFTMIPLLSTLEYLSRELHAAGTEGAQKQLWDGLAHRDPREKKLGREVLTQTLRLASFKNLRVALRREQKIKNWIQLVRGLLFPSKNALLYLGEIHSASQLPRYWMKNWIRAIVRVFRHCAALASDPSS